METVRLNSDKETGFKTEHLYSLGTDKGTIEVEANHSHQACYIARHAGYVVHDCNMIG